MKETDPDEFVDKRKGAIFSDDRDYRYRLWRTWDVDLPLVGFIMLNPSTADETEDDQTSEYSNVLFEIIVCSSLDVYQPPQHW